MPLDIYNNLFPAPPTFTIWVGLNYYIYLSNLSFILWVEDAIIFLFLFNLGFFIS